MPSTRSNQPPSKNWKKMARKQQGAEAKWDLTLEIHKSLGSLGRVGILSGSSAMAAPVWPSTHCSTSLETSNPGGKMWSLGAMRGCRMAHGAAGSFATNTLLILS